MGKTHPIRSAAAQPQAEFRPNTVFENIFATQNELRTNIAELGNRIDIPECLEELAIVAEACGRAVRAARLLGAASAMRTVTGARFSVDEQAIARMLLRGSEEPQWKAALVEGNQMSQEQAVAYALSEPV